MKFKNFNLISASKIDSNFGQHQIRYRDRKGGKEKPSISESIYVIYKYILGIIISIIQ